MSQVSEVLDSFIRVLAQLAPFLLIGFFAAGMLHVYLPSGLLARILGRPGFGSTVKAALLGVPLPLCSCAVIPVAVELRNSGASRGATASFLVATPETGVDSVAASMAVMHPLIVVFRPIVALVTAVTVGIAVERFSRPRGDREPAEPSSCHQEPVAAQPRNRFVAGLRYGFVDLFREISIYLVPALVVTALVTTLLDPSSLAGLVERPWLQMLILLAIGIPMYVCATGATPIAAALIYAGFSPGAALVFLMVGPATNLVPITAAANTLGKMGALVYCLAVVIVSIAFGVLLDALFAWLDLEQASSIVSFHEHTGTIEWIATGLFVVLLAAHVAAWARKALGR